MAIYLGNVKPWVKDAYNEIQTRYPCKTVYGQPGSGKVDHLAGLALDFMVFDDRNKGQAITDYAIANAERLGIAYVIWWYRIWYPSSGWRSMGDRGGPNQNHTNHVHLSFKNKQPTSGSVVETGNATNASLGGVGDVLSIVRAFDQVARWLSNGSNWVRIGGFILGIVLIMVALGKTFDALNKAATATAKVTKGAIKNGGK